ncbi:unnamed protein product [Cuscuta campestris]|uniref:Uncharacterized protein n=1 Tax=Cuscuta campestris TaxID=132261 RepID=A0A484MDV8_9ASTE|nr:unnamed protein product [Cuscuta campestris]
MSKTPMPCVDVNGRIVDLSWGRREQGVEWAGVIGPMHHGSHPKILHRKAMCIKFNGAVIITRKLANRNKFIQISRDLSCEPRKEKEKEEEVSRFPNLKLKNAAATLRNIRKVS